MQMESKKKSLTGRRMRLENGSADGRNQRLQLQNITSTDNPQVFDAKAYGRTVRRVCADAFVTLSLFPAKLRISYYVNRHGKLVPRAETRAGI